MSAPRQRSPDQVVGENIRRLRLERHYSRKALAARLGVDPEVLRAYEAGERRVSVADLYRVVIGLGVTPRNLMQPFAEPTPASRTLM